MFTCPVCEWPKLRRDPYDETHEICPQCGLQFGYGDAGFESKAKRHAGLRAQWIARGRPWHSKVVLMLDAKFHAFQELSRLLDKVLPKGYQLTKEQGDAVHACAKKLAEDLTSGEYRVE